MIIRDLEKLITNVGKHYRIKDLDDYRQEVLLILFEKGEDFILELRSNNKLHNYVYRVCVIQVLSVNSPFYINYIYPDSFKELNGIEIDSNKCFNDNKLEELLNSLKGIDKTLFEQLLKCRGNKQSLSKKSNISYSTINLMIKNLSDKIKKEWTINEFYD